MSDEIKISREEIVEKAVEDIRRAIEHQLDELCGTKLEEILEERVKCITDEEIKAQLTPIVQATMAAGWQVTNSYGEPKGPNLGVRERISEFLTKKSDSYSHEGWLAKTVEELLRKDFAEELKKVTAEFRRLVDANVQAKLKEALASSLGLQNK